MAAEREELLADCVDAVRELCFRWINEDNGMSKWECAEALLEVLAGHSLGESS